MPRYNLFEPIIKLSVADNWDEAKLEWELVTIIWREEGGNCICTHFIKEHCQIENIINGNNTVVGNCCINQFPRISGDVVDLNSCFRALKNKRINPALVDFARDQNIINDWEMNFLLDLWLKRKLTYKQQLKKDEISRMIFKACRSEGVRKANEEKDIE